MEKMLNIVLFGPPGAGKGTQSENLINKYNLVHLSTGDILRSEIARGTELGKRAKEIMDRGELVGDDIVIGMIESKLDENPHAKGFIFDGFPRTAAQAIALDDLLQKKGSGISGMLALEVENEELVKRLLRRGQDSGRADDRDETVIRRRIQEYNNKTLPLKNYYSGQGKFHLIDGIGSVNDIFNSLVERITFLVAENDLTALETDLEHLDLTIKDFEVADDIAPELLLEIDAIKRAEAEEVEESKQERRRVKTLKSTAVKKATTIKRTTKKTSPVKRQKPGKATAKAKPAAKKNTTVKKPKKLVPVKTKKAAKKATTVTKKKSAARKPVKKIAARAKTKKPLLKKPVKKKTPVSKQVKAQKRGKRK